MTIVRIVTSVICGAALAISCGGPPAGPPPAMAPLAPTPTVPSASANLSGTWNGTAVDSQGATTVTWALTQAGTGVSGTVATRAVDPADGSCNSCHRNKTGTFSGTIDGSTLTLTMFFDAGGAGDPTPACMSTLNGTASTTVDTVNAAYSGADSCEGQMLDGAMLMTRHR